MPDTAPSLVILGAGAIGLSFAATFRDGGWAVTVAEPDAARRDAAPTAIGPHADAIAKAGLTQGKAGTLTVTDSPDAALAHAALALDCGPENLGVKQAIFADLLARAGPATILATASSAIPMSHIVTDPAQQARCLVAHPVNPPAILRVVELVPAPGTTADTRATAETLFAAAGFATVTLGHEVEGFVMNRLQSAVLREAYRLVDEGVTDVDGIDSIMRLALGPRWALSGPFETAELNTPGGIRAHAARMGPAYKRIGEGRGETVDWHDALVSDVERQRRALLPAEDIPARVTWRADAVARLVAFRDALMKNRHD